MMIWRVKSYYRCIGLSMSTKYGLMPFLNLTLVVDRCTDSGIRSDIVIPLEIGLFMYFSCTLLWVLNLISRIPPCVLYHSIGKEYSIRLFFGVLFVSIL